MAITEIQGEQAGLETGEREALFQLPGSSAEPSEAYLDPYRTAETFWLNHMDLLPEAAAVVLQAGVDEEERLVPTSEAELAVVSLVFDATRRVEHQYLWQLTVATKGQGREVWQLATNTRRSLMAKRAFDSQGRGGKMFPGKADGLARLISQLAKSEIMANKAAFYRSQRERAEQELRRVAVLGIAQYSPELRRKKMAALEKRIEGIGFGKTSLEVSPAPATNLRELIRPEQVLTT